MVNINVYSEICIKFVINFFKKNSNNTSYKLTVNYRNILKYVQVQKIILAHTFIIHLQNNFENYVPS